MENKILYCCGDCVIVKKKNGIFGFGKNEYFNLFYSPKTSSKPFTFQKVDPTISNDERESPIYIERIAKGEFYSILQSIDGKMFGMGYNS